MRATITAYLACGAYGATEFPAAVPNGESHGRARRALLVLCALACLGACDMVSRHEVSRVPSPGVPALDAVLVEVNAGAGSTFSYDVFVVAKGTKPGGPAVATLVGAVRNDEAYGVNLKWVSADHLQLRYLRARSVQQAAPTVRVEGQQIRIESRPGVTDPAAPAGGMEYNQKQQQNTS